MLASAATSEHDVIINYTSVYVGSPIEAHATPSRSSHFNMIIGYIIVLPLLLALVLQWINSVDVESKCTIISLSCSVHPMT